MGPQVTTFTPAELTGDFSHADNGQPDPGVAQFLATHPYFQSNPQLAAQAIINPSSIDPVAQAIIKNERIPTSLTGILTPNGVAQDNRDEFSGKTDFNITSNERLSFNFFTGHFFFNPSAFYLPDCFSSSAPPGTPGGCPVATYGNLQRNTLRGPGFTNLDLSLEKKTKFNERVELLFRAEFFNSLNHTEFLSPTAPVPVTSALVGQSTSTNLARIGQLALKLVF